MTSGPSPEIDVVRSFLKALEAKDLESALGYLADDVEYQNMPLPPTRSRRAAARVLRPVERFSGFEAQIRHIAANGAVVLTERTDAVFIGPVRIPIHVCGTFDVRDGKIVLWRETFDWASAVANAVIAGPLYAFRRVTIPLGMKIAIRKAERAATRQSACPS
jgi:limonene-1,2-epoxide hydrolase